MDDDGTTRQFDDVVQRAGLRIEPERRKTMLSAYLQVVAWSEIVHDHHLLAQMEPSNVFDPRCDGFEREADA
ncbi:MAG: hypothetical protein ACI9DC_005439 [Gammaproteobacteria bacterium]|jgi:hypothetical protein